jgi:NifB/MoaA-like Fe-S oxidoreductase
LALTRYNTDDRLTPVTPKFCRQAIAEVTQLQKELRKRLGTTFAFLGDEIYLRAGHPLPGRSHYGNYPQIEDGIGMVRSFKNDFEKLLKKVGRKAAADYKEIHGTVLTGTMFAPILKTQIEALNEFAGTQFRVVGVENNYFGGDVSVAGLLTGGDLLAARDQIAGNFLVIPRSTLKSDEEIFLDGMSLEELSQKLGLPIHPVDLDSFITLVTRADRAA